MGRPPSAIEIVDACEGTLDHVTLSIPKGRLVVFSGVSGSGKSTLLVDVLFNECQRIYLEALAMQGIRKPRVGRVRGASPAILIGQAGARPNNPRSTVGTLTDVYTDLRMVFEKLSVRTCPHCGATVCAAQCREQVERRGDDFHVYMYCSACGARMDKLTRTHFSFNTEEGSCPVCSGLGEVHDVDLSALLDPARSLEEGAVRSWEGRYAEYQREAFYATCAHFGLSVPRGSALEGYDGLQRALLLEGSSCADVLAAVPGARAPRTLAEGRFEGALPILRRKLAEGKGDAGRLARFFATVPCPACRGERLAAPARDATVEGVRLPELAGLSCGELYGWVEGLGASLPAAHRELVSDYLLDLATKLSRLERVGLGHLALDRPSATLSGGEAQRIRLAAALDSELSGVVYILDEPTAGLHPQDTAGLLDMLRGLRDKGNSVLVVEHDPDVLRAADWIVDMGPGSGTAGGRVVAQGTLSDIESCAASQTGRWLAGRAGEAAPHDRPRRLPKGAVEVRGARANNLAGIDVDVPTGCLVGVTGPSGSGKTSLVFGTVAAAWDAPAPGAAAPGRAGAGGRGSVGGLSAFDAVVRLDQGGAARSRRSNVATYTGVYDEVRAAFASTDAAKAAGLTARSFSFNSPGGRCEVCEGLGYVENNLMFFTDARTPCPACHGRRFTDEVLAATYAGHAIDGALDLTVDGAIEVFAGRPKAVRTLRLLADVGLGYLKLGQGLSTLSGGEAQRLRLARELVDARPGARTLYLMDEPTRGLHPCDVERFLALADRLVDAGNTVVVVEHNLQVVERCDCVIDLGPGGGRDGGRLVFRGTPEELAESGEGATARCLRAWWGRDASSRG